MSELTDTLDASKVMSDETLLLSEEDQIEVSTTATDYFAAVRLSRQQARDSAVNLLQEVMADPDQTKAAESSADLEEIVQTALTEAQIESLIIAKGYTDCVAYMSTKGISVAVSAPEGGLQADDVAVIADIVMSQSDYNMDEIRVVEVQ
jgi:stage III sporulation protein AH